MAMQTQADQEKKTPLKTQQIKLQMLVQRWSDVVLFILITTLELHRSPTLGQNSLNKACPTSQLSDQINHNLMFLIATPGWPNVGPT